MPKPTRSEPTPITSALLREWTPPDAGTGTVLVVGGARRSPGAVLLSGIAALRTGAVTLQLAVVDRHASALGLAVPEALVVGLPETDDGAVSSAAADVLADLVADARAVVVGPGLADADETGALLERLLPLIGEDTRVVLDAFALGALGNHPELAKPVHGRLVLTPNTIEAAYLLGRPNAPVDDYVAAAVEIAGRHQAVVNLMGVVAEPDGRVWTDGAGHVGLSTSGSGDVLAGLVGGLLAGSADLAQATCWAGHVHAMAGQRLVPRTGLTGMLARELLDEVPLVFAELRAG
ncbi:NAD(P)H-hydrate dehydratase [Umezawaea sp. Da 62-37]|uniref:NAD(P)H-hydrate dehydratase n=1 Tax=Umezawaea sp. Da 62-37 TaxID=3075927 RepID=UPI0028F724F8|nr:NAD(P)H-hydrate dehydratase [Umezawaea sp. Da 62-37]WNV86224.1 NAD(P)H-hydrate dehydratase [Umezawaea sp. Da 62-37]